MHTPPESSKEAEILEVLRNPKDWVHWRIKNKTDCLHWAIMKEQEHLQTSSFKLLLCGGFSMFILLPGALIMLCNCYKLQICELSI